MNAQHGLRSIVRVFTVTTEVVLTYGTGAPAVFASLACSVVVPATTPLIKTLVEFVPAGIIAVAATVAIPAFTVLRFTVTGALGAGPVSDRVNVALAPGPTRRPAGRTIRSAAVVLTLVAVTLPVNPPEALPVTLHVPGVVVERTLPYVPTGTLRPAGITTLVAVSVQIEDDAALRTTVIVLGAATFTPEPST